VSDCDHEDSVKRRPWLVKDFAMENRIMVNGRMDNKRE